MRATQKPVVGVLSRVPPSRRTRIALIVLLTAWSASGCANTYRSLPSEDDVPELAAMKRLSEAVPQRTIRIAVRTSRGHTLRVALHESGPADAPRTIVLIHGVLSDSSLWRHVRGELALEHRVILVDLPGSGASDAPHPRRLAPEGYSPDLLCAATLDALAQHLGQQEANAGPITFAAHSFGGMLVLRMFADEQLRRDHAAVLDRVDGFVLFTPIDVALEKEPETFKDVAFSSDTAFAIASLCGIIRERVAASTLEGVVDPSHATREEADRLVRILRTPRLRRAHQSMLLRAVPWRQRRPDWPRIEELVAGYERVDPPCLIVWGARDEIFPLSMGYKLATEVPQARLRIVPAAMHSLPTEHPVTCTRLIRDFVSGAASPERVRRVQGLGLEVHGMLNLLPQGTAHASCAPRRTTLRPLHVLQLLT